MGWKQHGNAMRTYYELDFRKAKGIFKEVLNYLPDDFIAKIFLKRCDHYAANPPPPDWNGLEVMKEK